MLEQSSWKGEWLEQSGKSDKEDVGAGGKSGWGWSGYGVMPQVGMFVGIWRRNRSSKWLQNVIEVQEHGAVAEQEDCVNNHSVQYDNF